MHTMYPGYTSYQCITVQLLYYCPVILLEIYDYGKNKNPVAHMCTLKFKNTLVQKASRMDTYQFV